MKQKSRFIHVFFVLLVVLVFKWNCLNGRHPPETVKVGQDSCPDAIVSVVPSNSVSSVNTGEIMLRYNETKSPKTYRGVLKTELVSLPWTPTKALESEHEPWWGQPFDSMSFWKDRPIWLDDEARSLALRRGRHYPPVPPQFASGIPQKVLVSDSSTLECRMPRTYYTEEEARFWNKFAKSHPHPPEEIDRWLQHWSEMRVRAERIGIPRLPSGKELKTPGYLNRKEPRDTVEFARSDAASVSLPVEAATEKALYWEYVRGKRDEYETMVHTGRTIENDTGLKILITDLECPIELIRQPPSDEELRVTRGWRIDYLLRLRREGTDESYIEAYKNAWSLSEDDLREEEKE